MHVDGWDQIGQNLRLGAFGPITDLLTVRGDVGVHFGERGTMLGSLAFNHIVGPSTTQSLRFMRDVTLFQDQVFSCASYEIQQLLGPELTARAFASYGDYSDIRDGSTVSNRHMRFGVNLTYSTSAKTRISWDAYYGHVWEDNGTQDYFGTDVVFSYKLSDTLDLDLAYAFERGENDFGFPSSATRNTGVVQLRKYFR